MTRAGLVGFAFGLVVLASALSAVAQTAPGGGAAAAAAPAAPADPEHGGQNYVSPLTPPDVSSPRASLLSFRSAVRQATRLLIEAYREQQQSPGLLTPADAAEKATRAEALLMRAARVFDFSQVPPASLHSERIESVLLLKEILDRIPLPPFAAIPDADEIEDEAEREHAPPLPNWTIPGTEITFVRVESLSGSRYLVSPGTVDRLEDFYNVIANRPTRPDAAADLYDFYSLTPGMLLPPKWLNSFLVGLPDWAQAQYFDEAVWQWTAMIGGALLALLIVWTARRLERRMAPASSAVVRNLRRLALPVLIILVTYFYDRTMDEVINITGPILRALDAASFGLTMLAAAWATVITTNTVAEWILESPSIPSESLDANLLRAAFRLLGIAAGAVILGIGATNLGIPLVGVIAGLGVGGIAIALAAQPTIENFIGGIILYADRPVRVGDLCKFGDMIGTVESIGIRSTRIRGRDRTLITVPNADFSKLRIVNLTRRDKILFQPTLTLRYETTPDQLRFFLARAREMLQAHPMVAPEPARVRLAELNSSSLDVHVFAYVKTNVVNEFMAVQEDLLLRLIDIASEAGTGFAFPSQTTYLARDSRPGHERRTEVEDIVRRWREQGRLPFPFMTHDERAALEDTLDWPPKGSGLAPADADLPPGDADARAP